MSKGADVVEKMDGQGGGGGPVNGVNGAKTVGGGGGGGVCLMTHSISSARLPQMAFWCPYRMGSI